MSIYIYTGVLILIYSWFVTVRVFLTLSGLDFLNNLGSVDVDVVPYSSHDEI